MLYNFFTISDTDFHSLKMASRHWTRLKTFFRHKRSSFSMPHLSIAAGPNVKSTLARKYLLKWKDQNYWPLSSSLFRSTVFSTDFFYATSYHNEEVYCTEHIPSARLPCFTFLRTFLIYGRKKFVILSPERHNSSKLSLDKIIENHLKARDKCYTHFILRNLQLG